MLYFYQWLGLRSGKSEPSWSEISLHLLLWSIFFEWLGPRIFHRGTADWLDVVAYTIGAFGAGLLWNGLPSLKKTFQIPLAEGVGFEPTEPCGSPVFKTGAIDHSTTPPFFRRAAD